MRRTGWIGTGAGAVLAAAVGVGVLVAPTAQSQAALPPVSPEDLVSSVITSNPGPLNGTVTVANALGLPALPGLPQAANGTSTARVWSGGDGTGRVALPSAQGERTLVSDGTTRWSYDSEDRTATRAPAGKDRAADPQADPAGAATRMIGELRRTSTVSVDGTSEVAGRPVYQLVLTPAPTERTLLRQVRVAVDAEKRLPLQLTVLSQGSADPALQVGFSDITFGAQDRSLFTFTPPPGTTVKDAPARPEGQPGQPGQPGVNRPDGTTVGDGWDAVRVGRVPAQDGQRREGAPDLAALGTPVSGPWGAGRAITTAVGTAIVTNDGRFAVGAVPEQVVTEALGR